MDQTKDKKYTELKQDGEADAAIPEEEKKAEAESATDQAASKDEAGAADSKKEEKKAVTVVEDDGSTSNPLPASGERGAADNIFKALQGTRALERCR